MKLYFLHISGINFALTKNKVTLQRKKRQTVEEMMGITAFLRRPPIYLLLYGWCTERRDRLPDEDWKETIRQFKIRFNIPDEIECDEAMYLGVYRMTLDLINEGI